MEDIVIGGKPVGKEHPVLIIAEAGINHDGKLEQAFKLIDIAVKAGADIVKFQLFKSVKMYTSYAGQYKTANGKLEDITQLLKAVELQEEWIPILMDYCRQKQIGFLCTVCDEDGLKTLIDNGVDSFKLASYAITHIPLLTKVAACQKPVIFSTAGAYLSDVDIAMRAIESTGNEQIVLMHCVAKYPTPLNKCNLSVLETFRKAYPNTIIGYSDHSEEPTDAPIAAVKLGAKVIEKHFTLDKSLPGADHCFALNPCELKKMVNAIRNTESLMKKNETLLINEMVLGSSRKILNDVEEDIRRFAYRSIFADTDLAEGDLISKENIIILRPGNSEQGIDPVFYDLITNSDVHVNRKIKKGQPIKWCDIFNHG